MNTDYFIIRVHIYSKNKKKGTFKIPFSKKKIDGNLVRIKNTGTGRYIDISVPDDMSETQGYYFAKKVAKEYLVNTRTENFYLEIAPGDLLFEK